MPPVLEKLCSNTYTTSDLHRRLGLLQESLEEIMYHEEQGSEAAPRTEALRTAAESFGSHDDAQAITQWGADVWGSFTQHDVASKIAVLKKEAETLPSMIIYLPVVFDEQAIASLGLWVRKNIDPHLMLEVQIDPGVTGGCAFVFQDTYHDYSLGRAVEKHRGVVTELLASYAG